MGALGSIYITNKSLKEIISRIKKDNAKGIELTLSISDKTNKHGQNVSAYIPQSKEERENKTKKTYIGNGKIFWTDGKVNTAEKKANKETGEFDINNSDDLPF